MNKNKNKCHNVIKRVQRGNHKISQSIVKFVCVFVDIDSRTFYIHQFYFAFYTEKFQVHFSKRERESERKENKFQFLRNFSWNLVVLKMLFYLGVFLATIIFYLFRFHYDLVHQWYLSLKIPGPTALPIIGNGLLFLNRSPTGKMEFCSQFVLLCGIWKAKKKIGQKR